MSPNIKIHTAPGSTVRLDDLRGRLRDQSGRPVRHQPTHRRGLPPQDGARTGLQSGRVQAGEKALRVGRGGGRGQPGVRVQEGPSQTHREHVLEEQEEPGHGEKTQRLN